ncbi:MAG: glycosyltransferase [Phycisphaerales bacterium]
MRVLTLTDEIFAVREQSFLARLEIGLAAEGVRVFRAMPETAMSYAPSPIVARTIPYHVGLWQAGLDAAARRVEREIDEILDLPSVSPAGPLIDAVHVFGGNAWQLGEAIAREIGSTLLIEVWRSGLAPRVRTFATRTGVSTTFLSPDSCITRVLGELTSTSVNPFSRAGASSRPIQLREALWGVITPTIATPIFEPGRLASIMIVGAGRDPRGYTAAVAALGALRASGVEFMVFCDADTGQRAGVQAAARRAGLIANLSMVAELENRRDLVLEGDLILLPEANGEQRTVILDAFATGIPVIASKDPMNSVLIDGQTASIVESATVEAWSAAITRVVREPGVARKQADSARSFAASSRRASDYLRAVLDAYDAIRAADPIPFPVRSRA